MIVVMQCAGSKKEGGYLRSGQGQSIHFVGRPHLAPSSDNHLHAHPDDPSESGSWRDRVVAYNDIGANPDGLWRAFELYDPPADPTVYQSLVDRLGVDKVFILSAGWGLLRASFLTPQYDITFAPETKRKAPWKYRGKEDRYSDFCHLSAATKEPVFFVGGMSYLPLFCRLTNYIGSERTVFYNSENEPKAPGCKLERFVTNRRMNWQYDCARWLLGAL